MIVEIVTREHPKLQLEGYEKITLSQGVVYANPTNRHAEIVVKEHHDGRISTFTNSAEVIKMIADSGEIIDLHAK